jgi:hypothetical protein
MDVFWARLIEDEKCYNNLQLDEGDGEDVER